MITEQDLKEAIAECQGQRNPNANTAIKLAAFLTIQRELFGNPEQLSGYSFAAPPAETPTEQSGTLGDYGKTEFLQAVKGKSPDTVFRVIDEVMDMLKLVNERAYNGYMRKLEREGR